MVKPFLNVNYRLRYFIYLFIFFQDICHMTISCYFHWHCCKCCHQRPQPPCYIFIILVALGNMTLTSMPHVISLSS